MPASIGVGATTPASTIVAALTGTEPVAVIGRGSGIDDAGWMRKAAAVRDALRRAKPVAHDPLALLRVAGGADLAVLTGFCLQAAVRRTPVLLDGLVVGAAAVLADVLAPGAREWWLAAQRSPEPAMAIVLDPPRAHAAGRPRRPPRRRHGRGGRRAAGADGGPAAGRDRRRFVSVRP